MTADEDKLGITQKQVEQFHERLLTLIGSEVKKDFAEKVGLTYSGLRKYLPPNNSKPTLDKLVAISRYKNVNLEWLATGLGPKDSETGQHSLPGELGDVLVSSDGDVFELVDGYHLALDGTEGDWESQQVRRKLAFRKKWLEWRGLKSDDLKIYFVQGPSDSGSIRNGDSVMLDTSDTRPSDGVFAIKVSGSILIRRLYLKIDGGADIYIENKSEPEENVSKEELDNIEFVGRVVWLGKDM
ncbi:S24 family peptidase [Enterovibrio norvegicus]|uniref:HTH cro/C1-type domain-containing protein n=1 Tax=Enterovibrio norvegicus TaxID=188144 RepID=A0A2N7L849_9GAMM|nr:S24 family peptidase [Enterovibrio norvegicus]PMN73694.1 hypothetical protein BCT27_01415 [Enterovibrio norvegicus]PMN90292.1 hypothetical protein BCT23_20285 [Enterovibrio norvegicus]